MIIETIDKSKLKQEFNIACQRLLQSPKWDRTPFGLTWCVIKPQGETTFFAHHDEEVFIILDGQGDMIIDNERQTVLTGSVIQIPAFSGHQLINTSQDKDITFLSIHTFFKNQPALPKSLLILSPPPTPNGPLHLGHLAGPYLGADILKRYMTLRGITIHHGSGSDDYQSHVSAVAYQQKKTEKEIAEQFTAQIKKDFQNANIDLDSFMVSKNNPPFHNYVRRIFQKLQELGKIHYQDISVPYCFYCDAFLLESHKKGPCPQCLLDGSGSCCESCGAVNHFHLDTICVKCDQKANGSKQITLPLFPLEEYRNWLKNYAESVHPNMYLKKWIQSILTSPLKDFPLTLPLIWGIPVDENDPKSNVYHPWFEMACRYLWIQEQPNLDTLSDTTLFFGFDNSYYYTCLLPAIYKAINQEDRLANILISNQFYGYNGSKFSTSRQNGPTLGTFLKNVPSDIARLYLTVTSPQDKETSFDQDDFSHFQHTTMNILNSWFEDCNKAIEKKENIIPLVDQQWTGHQQYFYRTLNNLIISAEENYHPHYFSPKNIVFLLKNLGEISDTLLKAAISYDDINDVDFVLSLTSLKVFALIALPIMPNLSHHILTILNESPTWEKEVQLVKPKTIKGSLILTMGKK
jgi:methionyl-tRNA synthetase